MDKIDWKRKLTSRKFWMAVIGFIGPMLIAFGMSEEQSAQVTSLIMSGATVIAYLIAEGMTDAAGVEGNKGTEYLPDANDYDETDPTQGGE